MDLMGIIRDFAQLSGPAAVRALWQGAILTVGLALALRCARRISAADRFRIWAAAFAVLLVLPFLPLFESIAKNAANAGSASAPPAWAQHPLVNIDPRWSLAIAVLWLALSCWRAVDLLVQSLRLRRLWKNATPLVSSVGYAVCSTRELDRPSVIGFFAPRILIPDWLLERLTPQELEQVILHEAEHLRRRDDWTNLLQKTVLLLFPLHLPLVWVERRLCREREMACDEGVIRRTRAPRAYAACLASLAERGLKHRAEALSLGAWQRRPELVERVHRILRRGPSLHPAAARALLVVVGCGLIASSVEFGRCPQLVGFAAAPHPAQLAQANQADVVIDPASIPASAMLTAGRAAQGYRAVNTIAHLPSRAELTTARNNRGRTGSRREIKTNRPLKANAELPAVAAELPRQWVVFTTWEQIETTAQTAPLRGRTASSAGPTSPLYSTVLRGEAVIPATRQITVTGVYLAVFSAASPRAAANHSTTPAAPQRLPLQDGWLILQL